MIRGVPLFVHRWDPSKGLKKPEHSSCPLWVKLHNIPLVAFNKERVSRIASVLGIPKQMDSCTASMCEKTWGRLGFAKVLVEVWAVVDLKRKIDVEIPNINGGEAESVQIQVEYLWEPIQCSQCQIVGHKLSSYVKAASLNKGKQIDGRKDNDGFTRVAKKQWRVKGGSKANHSNGRTDNGRKESHPLEASLGVNVVSQEREIEEPMVSNNVELMDPPLPEGRDALGESGKNNYGPSSSSSKSSHHAMSTPTPLISSVIKKFRLPRRGVVINHVDSNQFGVLETLGEETSRVDNHDEVVNDLTDVHGICFMEYPGA
ncbi:uncharacterized protein LOC112504655 [Cynara cardunculus var. scolymus]|uniref:uncharacterized protein LOC112504655 n=1 Tax=Cynara cardunculus var. scolymus TaxID=59895 RepID=UPI000D62DF29|nr:uncharacterized protein LOC112504655 [Cynara cardunculus var. scolymus]